MDDADGLRLKRASEDSVTLSSSLAEPINLEDSHYARLRNELELDAKNLEADSWSGAVDQNYLRTLNKEAIKRQDVIYELIQTEMHHVRTLKTLLYVYMHELWESQLIEEAKLERLFPKVEALLSLHQHFLNCLKSRQSQSMEDSGPTEYQITQLGDVLIAQFSDALGESMIECYSVFCHRQSEAVSLYKEQLQNNKKLQVLMRKVGQLPIVRRLGIPECFLLVTQRITKYPVLVERLIQNTEADTDEHRSLVQGLARIKETISEVNDQVSEYEKAVRLREIGLRLEPKSVGKQKNGQVLSRSDVIHGHRTLLHEGAVTWRWSSGRQKDIHAVLLSDLLLLLQEKDQKLVFAAVDNKPPVISLQRLIVREVAHDDKALYLISACTTSLPEMYEIHTGSKEERITWTTLIREAVERYPQKLLQRQLIARLQHCQDALKERDDQIIQSLTEKQQIFADLFEDAVEQETPHRGLLLRGDVTDLQQGELLLTGAINEVEELLNLFFTRAGDPDSLMEDGKMQGSANTFGVGNSDSPENITKDGYVAESSDVGEAVPVCNSHSTETCPEVLEQSADEETLPVPNCFDSPFPEAEVLNKVLMLAKMLHSLKAVVVQQDSQIELHRAFQSSSQRPARHYSNVLLEQEKQRNLEKQRAEMANLHKLQAQHQDEQQRWEKEKERQRIQIKSLESEVQQREEECRKREEKLSGEKVELEKQLESYQHDLERLRESTRSVEKERERLAQEQERLEKYKSKYIPVLANYDDPSQFFKLTSLSSFRGSLVNNLSDVPPKVPPRRESILHQPPKLELPIHLISTTNQVQKPPVVQQKIPTKLATQPKGKEKGFKAKGSHQRAHSAASIDVSQLVPIRVTGKEGGSLRAQKSSSPQRICHSDTFKAPGSGHSVKTSQSFSVHKRSSSESPPPLPPPFPKDILEKGKGKEKVIFL